MHPEAWLPPEIIRPLYSLRWQIELLFKQIKTVLCIHKSNTSKENRLLCEIYGKLIVAVMIHRIHADINIRLWNIQARELSMEKLYKRIQERAFIILDLLLVSLQKAIAYLREEIPRLIKNCIKSRQRSRRSSLETIEYGPLSGKKRGAMPPKLTLMGSGPQKFRKKQCIDHTEFIANYCVAIQKMLFIRL